MEYLTKQNEVEAIQIVSDNYSEIVSKYPSYTLRDGRLVKADGTILQTGGYIVELGEGAEKTEKIMTESLFKLMFKEKPVEYYTLGELALDGKKARKADFADGDYVHFTGLVWAFNVGGIDSVYTPSIDDIANKVWLEA